MGDCFGVRTFLRGKYASGSAFSEQGVMDVERSNDLRHLYDGLIFDAYEGDQVSRDRLDVIVVAREDVVTQRGSHADSSIGCGGPPQAHEDLLRAALDGIAHQLTRTEGV